MGQFMALDENVSCAEVKSAYCFRHQRNCRIIMHSHIEKDKKGNGFVQINIPQILDMQNLTPDTLSYCREGIFFIRVLVAFLPLSELCLLHVVSTSPNKIFAN